MENQFMLHAIELSQLCMNNNYGGPFGCVIVKNGKIIGEGCNCLNCLNYPTALAQSLRLEMLAKRSTHSN